MMERLKYMREALISCVEKELGNLLEADSKELGEAIDMIKDLEETIYYSTITKAMEEKEDEKKYGNRNSYDQMYYMPRDPYYMNNRDMDRDTGKMYYDGGMTYNYSTPTMYQRGGNQGGMSSSNSSSNNTGSRNYGGDYMYPVMEVRDRREGRSPMSRKNYMESKEMHHGKEVQMKELENYMQELTSDVTEMIQGASPEEKQLLQKKIMGLVEKIK